MRWRDILWPWGALREARAEIMRLRKNYDSLNESWCDVERAALRAGDAARAAFSERDALRAELDRLAPKRDAKTGRFVG